MPIKKCFVSQIYYEKLWPSPQTARIQVEKLNQEAYRFSEVDESGREWCEDHYPLGYTCYASIPKLHQHSPHFAKLEKALAPHVSRYLKSLEYDITLNDLGLSSLWVNIMKPHCYHGLHIHPQSVISGTLYLQCPKGSGALKIEDPRHAQMMLSLIHI